jgi:hypothetical protein
MWQAKLTIISNILFFIVIHSSVIAQTISWSSEVVEAQRRNPGYSRREFISSDKWNNCYSIYETRDSGNTDITITKFGNDSGSNWTRTYNTPENYNEYALGILTDTLGDSYILGSSDISFSRSSALVLKYSIEGDLIWAYAIDSANTTMNGIVIRRDNSGNILVLCNRAKNVSGLTFVDYLILKLSQDGNLIWKRVFDMNQSDVPRDLYTDNSNNICVTGFTYAGNQWNWLTVKFSADGDFLWSHVYTMNTSGQPQRNSVTGDNTGNFYVAGEYYTGANSVLRVNKYSPNGALLWVYYHNAVSSGTCITRDKYGNILVGGTIRTVTGTGDDIAAFKLRSSDGTLISAKYYEGTGNHADFTTDIKSDTSGNIYLQGNLININNSCDIVLIRLNNFLKEKWRVIYNSTSGGYDVSQNMSLKTDGTVFITGDCNINSTPKTNAVLKITDIVGSPRITGLQGENESLPARFNLMQNDPNPFNPSTTIKFSLPAADNVELRVYDIVGREVGVILNQKIEAGNHEAVFDGAGLASGVYFYRITTSSFTAVKKMMLIK